MASDRLQRACVPVLASYWNPLPLLPSATWPLGPESATSVPRCRGALTVLFRVSLGSTTSCVGTVVTHDIPPYHFRRTTEMMLPTNTLICLAVPCGLPSG